MLTSAIPGDFYSRGKAVLPLLCALVLLCPMELWAFSSPVHIPITLAGNFGEPRPNHFHGGIDVRTERQEGYPVFSIADGYVYRITIGSGYGNAVYVRHPDGKTSVYGHLKDFVPALRTAVSRWRLAHGQEDVIDVPHESSAYADIRLAPYEYPVSEGQLIAMSGNTGGSQAPHLHLEIRDTRTWAILDPLDYLGQFLKDSEPPTAHAFMAYPVLGQGVFEGYSEKHSFPFTDHHLTREFRAWGKVGFGLCADDHMEECYQKYGIRRTILTVDGREVFSSNVDSIPAAMNRFVNSWGDYDHYFSRHEWYMKSFIEPGNPLPILHADANRGIVNFCEKRDYHLEYTLTDVFGNESKYSFIVHGEPQAIPTAPAISIANVLRWDRQNNFQLPGLQLIIRPGSLATDRFLTPEVEFKPDSLSDSYVFCSSSFPLVRPAIISIRVKRKLAAGEKIYVDCDGVNLGGSYQDDWITAYSSDLGGTYSVRSNNDDLGNND